MKLATLCYVKAGGKTLMLHRIKRAQDMHAGKWNGLGGKLMPGESPEECVVREVREESGLALHNPELRGVLTFPSFSQDEDWYVFVFVAQHFAGELIECNEGVLAWIDDDKLIDLPLWEGDRIFLRWLEERRFFSGKFVYLEGRLTKHEVVFYTLEQDAPQEKAGADHPATGHPSGGFVRVYTPADDAMCWVCEGPAEKRNCKIVCRRCGFTRDCSDP